MEIKLKLGIFKSFDFANEMVKDTSYLPDGRHVNQKGSDLKRDLLFSYFTTNGIIPALLQERSIEK